MGQNEEGRMKFWAIYMINIGSSYADDMALQIIADETLEKLTARIPASVETVYVTTSEPVQYSLKFVPTFRRQ